MLTPPVRPMLAATTSVLPEPSALRGGCLYQPKFDGYRALVFHHPAGSPGPSVSIQTRAGNLITGGFPEIAAAVTTHIPPGVVLDGELVVWDGHGVNFAALAGRMGATRRAERLARERPATLMAFDLLAVEGTDIRRLPLLQRQELLAALFTDVRPPLQMVPTTQDLATAQQWVADYTTTPGLGIEGLVIKAAADPYTSGARGWLKYRVRQTYDVVVGAVLGPRSAPNRLVLGYHDDDTPGRLRVAGATIPLGARQARTIAAHLAPPVPDTTHPWPPQMPAGWLGNWSPQTTRLTLVEPQLVVEVSADTAFEHGRWRHQVRYMRARTDKDPADVRRPDTTS